MKVETMADMRKVWRKAGQNGGRKRADKLSKKRLQEIARMGGLAGGRGRKKTIA